MKMSTVQALKQLESETKSVQIQKYSETSLISDCKMLRKWLALQDISYGDSKKNLGSLKIHVWRCRIGRSGWQHGWSFDEAVNAALYISEKV